MKHLLLFVAAFITTIAFAQDSGKLELLDIYNLEYVSNPEISPDGKKVIYVRNFKDVMTDMNLSNLWIINFDGSDNRPITTGNQKDFQPKWSVDGQKVVYKSDKDGTTQVYLKWLDTGAETKITNTEKTPGNISMSPDGRYVAFSMFVDEPQKQVIKMPKKPEGAEWNDPPKYIDDLKYRSDGAGYLKSGFNQLFILPLEGGTPRQLTYDANNHGSPVWTRDSKSLLFSANLHAEGEYDPRNSEVYSAAIVDGRINQLTTRQGPDYSPVPSPDGSKIAYLGFDDHYQGYQVTDLYVMNADGSASKLISKNFDRDVEDISWSRDGKGLYFKYDDKGDTRIAYMSLTGKVTDLAKNVGGLSLGRPYSSGSFSINSDGKYALTLGSSSHPSDLATGSNGSSSRLTRLNDDLFDFKTLGRVEELWFESSYDKRQIQGWVVYPPDFNPSKKYPMILESMGVLLPAIAHGFLLKFNCMPLPAI